jgi:hypothetical protein
MSEQRRDYILFIEDILTCIEKIDLEAVWDTLRNNIPSFKKQIVNVLKSEKASEEE